jgi:hypothetical protein
MNPNVVVFGMPTPNHSRKTQILQAAASPRLAEAVRVAAERNLMTISEFTQSISRYVKNATHSSALDRRVVGGRAPRLISSLPMHAWRMQC